jgi:hypothetical protein
MSTLRDSMAEYLAVRRALGYRLEGTERLLRQFLDHLPARPGAPLPSGAAGRTRCLP